METILVTGGSKGIGKEVCKKFAMEGYRILFTSRGEEGFKELEAEYMGLGASLAKGYKLDIGDKGSVKSLVEKIKGEGLGLKVLVNNAGVGIFKGVKDLSYEEWDLVVGTNLSGVFYLTQGLIGVMEDTGGGNIINIGSLASRNTFAGGGSYCATKFGLLGFTECLMLELRDQNIKVSIVMPGSVNTSFSGKELLGEEARFKLSAKDVAKTVHDIVKTSKESLISKIELRPLNPKKPKS